MIKGVIIEDEQNARETLRLLLDKYCKNVEIVGEAVDVKSGLECIEEHEPELVFLDIEMPDGDGFDLLSQVDELNFDIIFTTAYSEFAVQAFKYNAVDYLLKPIVHDELIEAVSRAEQELQTRDLSKKFNKLLDYIHDNRNDKRIVLSSTERYDVVNVSEIIMLKSDRNYTYFYLEDGQVIKVSKTMKEYVKMLSSNGFVKSHRQYLVNVNHIRSFSRTDANLIRLTRNLEAPVSSRNRDKLLEIINSIY
jgi:two-component system LytT family response regulator